MVVSRTVVDANAAFAGTTLEVSFARLRASMATFSEDRVPSCPSGRWELVVMVRPQSSHEEAVRHASREEEDIETSVHPIIACLV